MYGSNLATNRGSTIGHCIHYRLCKHLLGSTNYFLSYFIFVGTKVDATCSSPFHFNLTVFATGQRNIVIAFLRFMPSSAWVPFVAQWAARSCSPHHFLPHPKHFIVGLTRQQRLFFIRNEPMRRDYFIPLNAIKFK